MTQVCHECSENLYNPFYEVNLALVNRESGRVALSDLSTTICRKHYSPNGEDSKINPTDMNSDLVLAVDEAHGCLGGVTGAVQMCMGLDRHLQFKYIDLSVGKNRFPKSVSLLVRSPDWMEYIDGKWQRAIWANEIYARLQKEEIS